MKYKRSYNTVNYATTLHVLGKVAQGKPSGDTGVDGSGLDANFRRHVVYAFRDSTRNTVTPDETYFDDVHLVSVTALPVLSDPRFWELLRCFHARATFMPDELTPRAVATLVFGLYRCDVKYSMAGVHVVGASVSGTGSEVDADPTVAERRARESREQLVRTLLQKLANVTVCQIEDGRYTSQGLAFVACGMAYMDVTPARGGVAEKLWSALSRAAIAKPPPQKVLK
jgi:hypothetical protein